MADTVAKSFWGEEQKFLEPLMRFTRGDVEGHIVSSKSTTDLPSGVKSDAAQRRPKINFREILGLIDFDFATVSARTGHA